MGIERTLIRGGCILTMDPAQGDLPAGDVLVEGDRIVAISPRIEVDDALVIEAAGQVVMPGMVDTHRHTWQTQMRAICADWTLTDYFLGMRLTISPAYAADDVYVGNYVGALEALNAGVTTILDFSHCNNSPEHADAAVKGLEDAAHPGVALLRILRLESGEPGFSDPRPSPCRLRSSSPTLLQ